MVGLRSGPRRARWLQRLDRALAVPRATIVIAARKPRNGSFQPASTHVAWTDYQSDPNAGPTRPGAHMINSPFPGERQPNSSYSMDGRRHGETAREVPINGHAGFCAVLEDARRCDFEVRKVPNAQAPRRLDRALSQWHKARTIRLVSDDWHEVACRYIVIPSWRGLRLPVRSARSMATVHFDKGYSRYVIGIPIGARQEDYRGASYSSDSPVL